MTAGTMVIESNLIDERVGFSKSSEASGFPALNALDISKRRQTWRSAGHWLIESGSNTLVIKDSSGGSNLTATIAAASYGTDAAFFAALKAALEAVSDSTFTITRNGTTKKIVITAVLGGAASAFQIVVTHADSAAMCGILGFSTASNLTGSLAYTADLLRIHTSEWFVFDLGFPVSPTAFLAVADRNTPLRISPGAAVRLKGNLTDSWASPLVNVVVEVSDKGLAYVDRNGVGATACRFWKLEIIDRDNPYAFVELGAIVLGTHTVLTRGAVAFPLEPGAEDNSLVSRSEGGQTTGGARSKTKLIQLNWGSLDVASYEALEDVWEKFGLTGVFAIFLDPNKVFSTDLPRWSKLVRFASEPKERLTSPGAWSFPWSLREEL